MTVVTTSPPATNPWLISRNVDVLVVVCGAVLISLLMVALFASGIGFLVAALSFAVIFDFPHVLQTYTRIALDATEYRLYRAEILWSLLLIAGGVGYLLLAGDYAFLVTVWVYWQPYHVIKQHDGVTAIYCAKAGYRGARALLKAMLYLGCAAPIVYRMATRGLQFGDYSLWGVRMPFSNLSIPLIPIPLSVAVLVYAVFGITLVMLLRREVAALRQGQPAIPQMAWVHAATAVVSYNLAYLLISDLYLVILVATALHSLQYHALCWTVNNRKHEGDGALPSGEAPIMATVSQRRNVPMYIAGMLGAGALCASLELVAMGFVPLVLVLHHFYMDSVIWKGQRNPDLAKHLGLARPKLAPQS